MYVCMCVCVCVCVCVCARVSQEVPNKDYKDGRTWFRRSCLLDYKLLSVP